MSKNSTAARHRANPTHSIALEGLSLSARNQAKNLGRPALAVAAASGLVLTVGMPAQAAPGDAAVHNVVSGDTLGAISANYGANLNDVLSANSLGLSSIIYPGDQISIPGSGSAAAAPAAPAAAAPAAGNTHSVVSGDTLGAIASKYGVSLNDVLSANGLGLSSVIYPGNQITIPAAGYVAPAAAPAPAYVAPAPAAPVYEAPAYVAPAPAAPAAPANTGINTASSVTPTAIGSGKGAAILGAARAQLGAAQDCTALVTNSLAAVGINFHDWPAGYLGLGTQVSAAQAQPGDLVYYANGGAGAAHIAVYAGNGMAVHGGWNGFTTVEFSVNVGSGPVFVRV
ncbi:LysM peptidoglycan-binding domain-containing protein [Pseudarthrobacter sp. PS3-L1]|uniref:LysM peptidoglycan-binding domain-containing protein n=1 Tax=Pseudarthrobacter sp. PS3-L1 TaxID=3046207 RepID=UPI0024B89945|nr:LysM peptidoglycan-binding domain-containing protein [Pseudarthrobacter sp. PS3-L1]MDJ0320000.1 LysM peptidoglycan-binding domain-containing protein [Pseudarthrobacter sp. PS3-L1]